MRVLTAAVLLAITGCTTVNVISTPDDGGTPDPSREGDGGTDNVGATEPDAARPQDAGTAHVDGSDAAPVHPDADPYLSGKPLPAQLQQLEPGVYFFEARRERCVRTVTLEGSGKRYRCMPMPHAVRDEDALPGTDGRVFQDAFCQPPERLLLRTQVIGTDKAVQGGYLAYYAPSITSPVPGVKTGASVGEIHLVRPTVMHLDGGTMRGPGDDTCRPTPAFGAFRAYRLEPETPLTTWPEMP